MPVQQSYYYNKDGSRTTYSKQKNPFVHHISLTKWQMFQVALFSVTIAPIRAVVIILGFAICWLLALIFTLGADVNKPAGVFRRRLYDFLRMLGKGIIFALGFHSINVKGKRASPKEAPIIIAVPHSSFWDIIVLFVTSPFPSVISKEENFNLPIFGTLMKATQPILVQRNSATSRKNTVNAMQKRLKKPDNWPQLVIFPEGTCTNKKQLLKFKLGSFLAGVPVQPLIIRYKNQLDVITWTEISPRVFTLIWLGLCQVQLKLEVEYLPVYQPNSDEIKDPQLFANNIQSYLATILQVPSSNHTCEDRLLMQYAGKLNFPKQAANFNFYSVSKNLKIKFEDVISRLNEFSKMCLPNSGLADVRDFAKFYNVEVNLSIQELFDTFDTDHNGYIDFHQYVIGFFVILKKATNKENIMIAYKMLCQFSCDTKLNTQLQYGNYTEEVKNIIHQLFNKFGKIDNESQFKEIIENNPGYGILLLWYKSQDKCNSLSNNYKEDVDSHDRKLYKRITG